MSIDTRYVNPIKERDAQAREWLDKNFIPKKHLKLKWTEEQFAWNDADITSNTEDIYFLELKVRHVASTEYSGQTAIEEDKFNKLLQHKGKVALLVLFQDCICWFPPSQLFDAFVGITVLCNCADEMHPAYEKKWVKRNKAVGLFDTNKAVKYYYDEYGGKPEFV